MELLWFITDKDNSEPVTGGASYTSLTIRRGVDGYLYNWDTSSFAVSGGSGPGENWEEISAVLLPGVYKKVIDVSDWDDGYYQTISYYENGDIMYNFIYEFIIADGSQVDDSLSGEMLSTLQELNNKVLEVPGSTLLVQEYYSNIDADGNGLVYGVDFYITTGRPKMLDAIPKRGIAMTWTEYMATL